MLFSGALPFCEIKGPMFLDPMVSSHVNSCFDDVESGSQIFFLLQSSELKEEAKL